MKKKWDGQFKKAEEINDWAWWGLFVTAIVMAVIFILKVSGKI
ncbi:hypothetical protein ES705_41282 [subsurface metagenome]